MAELSRLRGVAGPGVEMADVRPALEGPLPEGAAFRFGGIFAIPTLSAAAAGEGVCLGSCLGASSLLFYEMNGRPDTIVQSSRAGITMLHDGGGCCSAGSQLA